MLFYLCSFSDNLQSYTRILFSSYSLNLYKRRNAEPMVRFTLPFPTFRDDGEEKNKQHVLYLSVDDNFPLILFCLIFSS